MSSEIWIGIAGLALHAIAITGAGMWRLTKSRDEVIKAVQDHRDEIQAVIEGDRRNFAETVAAVRQKLNDVELESYKTFVRRESFQTITDKLSNEVSSVRDAIEGRLDRQEEKLDRLIERVGHIPMS